MQGLKNMGSDRLGGEGYFARSLVEMLFINEFFSVFLIFFLNDCWHTGSNTPSL
jgi:hypothetical protein